LVREGHEVHVLCSRRTYFDGRKEYPKKETVNGVHIHRVGGSGFGRINILGQFFDCISFYMMATCQALCLPRMDTCVALTTPPFIGLLGLLLNRIKGTKVIIWTMDLYPETLAAFGVLKSSNPLYRSLAWISRKIYRQARKIISLGESMTQRLMEFGVNPRDIVTVHNWSPCETSQSRETNARKDARPEKQITMMYSGNLGRGHELDTVVKAIKHVKDTRDLRFLVTIGNGKPKEVLERNIAKMGLSCIGFRDPVPLEDLPGSLAAGHIHIVSQKPGTQGVMVPSKLYGIMAAGRPSIFIGPEDCESARIIRQSGAGSVVVPPNVEGVAAAIARLARDTQLRHTMGSVARAHYEKHFGRDRSVRHIIEAITESDTPSETEGMPITPALGWG